MKPIGTILAVLAMGAGSLVLSASPAASASPAITPAATAVARGADLHLAVTGCGQTDTEGQWFQTPEVVLISGSGAGARLAGLADGQRDPGADEAGLAVRVPGWVDPSQPAVLAGRCIRYAFGSDDGVVLTTAFSYPEVAIDITDAPAPLPGPLFTLDRTSAAGGQVLVASGSGCAPDSRVEAAVLAGADLSGRSGIEVVSAAFLEDPVTGPFSVELPLNGGLFGLSGEGGVGPLPEGPYSVVVVCGSSRGGGYAIAAPQPITVVGTNPSDAISIDQSGSDSLTVSGEGCTGGRTIEATFTGYAGMEWGFEEADSEISRAQASSRLRGSGFRGAGSGIRLAPDAQGSFTETVTATPGVDGTWSLEWSAPSSGYDMVVSVDCGDPTVDGFRYVDQQWYESNFSEVWIERTSPTSSPTGGPVTVHLQGECDNPGTARFADADGHVLSEGPLSDLNDHGMTSATLTAPATAGIYELSATCDGRPSYPEPYEVFAPTALAPDGPLPHGPTGGWPSSGARETYQGRIGPITLPPMEGMDMDDMATRALGPGGLFIDVPRPAGDFAINQMTFDLVDDQGMSVPQDEAHLHHFVITNASGESPSCPGSTFGLPGEIVGAAGAEKTVLDIADPYGLVVKGSDEWTGVYDVMNRTSTTRTVYLTYDLEIRRDVENVRPVRRYFGSATGCSSFTWTVDGNGTPDTQSSYVTIADDGVLLGAGGHIHHGGLHADLTNDRGRRLCRSELELGEMPIGHDHGTMELPESSYPPESYPDDLEITGISSCGLNEQVTKGERLRFDAVYDNERPRSGVMGIYSLFVWEGGGPAAPGAAVAPGAIAIPGRPTYTG